ncbi:MAG TPA: hypothetical protein VEW94_09670 [Chloroflexia bacterium]|nr:hypothetical protein [Chloroflexia bacterium]
MVTITATGVVTEDGKLTIQVPANVAPGEHQVVVVIDEPAVTDEERQQFTFATHDVGPWPENLSLRREDMYDEWGR